MKGNTFYYRDITEGFPPQTECFLFVYTFLYGAIINKRKGYGPKSTLKKTFIRKLYEFLSLYNR